MLGSVATPGGLGLGNNVAVFPPSTESPVTARVPSMAVNDPSPLSVAVSIPPPLTPEPVSVKSSHGTRLDPDGGEQDRCRQCRRSQNTTHAKPYKYMLTSKCQEIVPGGESLRKDLGGRPRTGGQTKPPGVIHSKQARKGPTNPSRS